MAEPVQRRLTRQGSLQTIAIDAVAADRLLADSHRHLATSEMALHQGDLAGAYQLLYDAARKSVTAFLAWRGFRIRGQGAHANSIELAVELLAGTPPACPWAHSTASAGRATLPSTTVGGSTRTRCSTTSLARVRSSQPLRRSSAPSRAAVTSTAEGGAQRLPTPESGWSR